MSSEEERKVSVQKIQQVQNLIEHCLQTYMNRREVVNALSDQAKVEPDFTEVVWDKLEEENQDFFKAYHVYLLVKQQIMIFNELLERHVKLMHAVPLGVASLPILNEPDSSLHQDPPSVDQFFVDPEVPKSRHHQIRMSVSPFNGLSMHGNMQFSDDNIVHTGMINGLPNMHYNQNSEMAMLHKFDELMIKTEPTYSDSGLMFDANGEVIIGIPQTVGDAEVPFYGSVETTHQPFNGPFLTTDTSSFMVGQIPNYFGLSDLAAHHFNSLAIQEGYMRSPLLRADVPDSYVEVNPRLDTTSDGSRWNSQ